MISSLDPSNQQFLTSLNDLENRVQTAETHLSSGLRVNQASDAPQEVGDIFQARADLSGFSQTIQNLNLVKAQVDTGDESVQSAVQLLQNALTLGTEGASTNVTQGQRNALATQVQ